MIYTFTVLSLKLIDYIFFVDSQQWIFSIFSNIIYIAKVFKNNLIYKSLEFVNIFVMEDNTVKQKLSF